MWYIPNTTAWAAMAGRAPSRDRNDRSRTPRKNSSSTTGATSTPMAANTQHDRVALAHQITRVRRRWRVGRGDDHRHGDQRDVGADSDEQSPTEIDEAELEPDVATQAPAPHRRLQYRAHQTIGP